MTTHGTFVVVDRAGDPCRSLGWTGALGFWWSQPGAHERAVQWPTLDAAAITQAPRRPGDHDPQPRPAADLPRSLRRHAHDIRRRVRNAPLVDLSGLHRDLTGVVRPAGGTE